MNPQRNVAAVAARDSLASTLVAATERLAQDLDGHDLCGPAVDRRRARRGRQRRAGRSGTDLEPSGLALPQAFQRVRDQLLADAVGHRLRDAGSSCGRPRHRLGPPWSPCGSSVDDGRPQVSAWVRYHSDSRLPREVSAGLNRLTGRQLAAVRASLPAPTTRPLLIVPSRELHDDDDLVLSVSQVRESATSVPAGQ